MAQLIKHKRFQRSFELCPQTQATEIEALLFPDLLCGIDCPLRCECLTVVSRPLGQSWRHCCLYDTLYIDRYIFSLPDSAFAAFLRGPCALQIALTIIITIIYL